MASKNGVQQLSSTDVRDRICDALDLDLVGPRNDSPLASEVLPQDPSRWYLTGFLAPRSAKDSAAGDETQDDELDAAEGGGSDDTDPRDRTAAQRARFPSSIGLSAICAADCRSLDVTVRWGDYKPVPAEPVGRYWKRLPCEARLTLALPERTKTPQRTALEGKHGMELVLSVRPLKGNQRGQRVVSVFAVNDRVPAGDDERDLAFAFQVEIEVTAPVPFVLRPNVRGLDSEDWDERVADLQYRDACELAVGHGVATTAELSGDECRTIRTCWIPRAEVERVQPGDVAGVELGMDALAALPDGETARQRLQPLVARYREWIAAQRSHRPAEAARAQTLDELMARAEQAAKRIEAGIDVLRDSKAWRAFQIANQAMATQARQRLGIATPAWRPFQLAFLLLNLPAVVDPKHPDREVVDLLFFPTGGGKTEAYLGLAVFTIVLRRLQNPGVASAGVSVLMRYTLRLLTLDQLSRAATVICALELMRKQSVDELGEWPFEIGLWVGRAATPNRMGRKGDNDPESARSKVIAYANNERKASPIPLETCPWCGTKFTSRSFRLLPSPDQPTDLRVYCASRDCMFTRDDPLPILAVDEPIYRRLPCFLIATVDKFAALPWTGEVGALLGRVDRYDSEGFYGPCTPGRGRPLPGDGAGAGRLLPPDLVIQDELHLISGPLGTIAGLYEAALDELATRQIGGKRVRPKIVASTATVRRADAQIRALFARGEVAVFPPPGPDRRDSWFAHTVPAVETPARRYLGIAAQGRSLKVVLLRSYIALLGAAQRLYEECGGKRNQTNPADPYMTLLGYFNSLRELGGSRRIVEDEVGPRASDLASRRRVGEATGLFADRRVAHEPVELTSRVKTDKVAEAKRRLGCAHRDDDHVDVALATNMISVGLDIQRLGLMVVLGQPKTSAEYIQATSRVGRDATKPGLVVTLLNIHRPRDRSHYERFGFYHETFYRSVEASSVTPFSPRALDRALAAAVVALARHGHAPMTPALGATEILRERGRLDYVVDTLLARAEAHAQLEPQARERLRQGLRARVLDLLDSWSNIANELQSGSRLQYQQEVGAAQRLLFEPLHPDLQGLPRERWKFRANRSMRDVEAQVNLWVQTLQDEALDDEGDDA